MKERFTTVDLLAAVEYLNRRYKGFSDGWKLIIFFEISFSRFTGMRVANIYDIDHKTYLLKLARSLSFSVYYLSVVVILSLSPTGPKRR